MFNKCKVCLSDFCAALDMSLASGCSVAMASRKYSLPVDLVRRHKKNHLPPELIRKARRKQLLGESKFNLEQLREHESENLLSRLVRQRIGILALIEKMSESDPRGAVQGHKALLLNLEIEGKLLGELGQHATNTTVQNLIVAPEYLRLRQLLNEALKPYPAAKAAVVAALRSVEQATDPAEPKQVMDESDDARHRHPTIGAGADPEHASGSALETVSVPSVESPEALAVEEGFQWAEIPATEEADPQTTASIGPSERYPMIVRA